MRTDWIRTTRQRLCQFCKKAGWCSVSADGRVAICMRVESDKPTRNGGWLHRLTDDDWRPPPRRTVRRPAPKPKLDCVPIHQRCVASMRPESLGWLSNNLGISTDVIERFEVGYHDDNNVFSMAMRRPNGSICGIKYRPYHGGKFCETGSKSGIFFVPGSLVCDYVLIVEGCSDAMAIHDLGHQSVIGRDNCTGNVEQIVTLFRRLKPNQVVIVPDNDSHGAGQRGAEALRFILKQQQPVELLSLPDCINDVRDCIQQKESADWLRNRIGELISIDQHRKDSTNE